MDCGNRIQTMKASAYVGMLLLLSVAVCVPGAAGSVSPGRHFQLRGRRMLAVIGLSPPPQSDNVVPVVSPPPSFPPPVYLAPRSPPPPSYIPPPVMPLVQPPVSHPPPMVLPAPILPPPPTGDPPPSPPLEALVPAPGPPMEPLQSPPPATMVSPSSSTWNESEKAGVVIAAIAALLQVAVVTFLLIKRHQMLTTVEYGDFEEESDNSDPDYRHPEQSA